MKSFGGTIRNLRTGKKLTLRTVASELNVDQAILSKMERGQRYASREMVIKIAEYYKFDKDELLILWLSDKLVDDLADEEIGLKALQVAEEKIEYISFKKIDRQKILNRLKNEIGKFSKVQQAWIYGSFSRKDDGPRSDIDIAIKADENFSYFDLAEVQFQLEKALNRKIDLGFIDSFRPYIFENIKNDLVIIYEK